MSMWIDNPSNLEKGDFGFLIQQTNTTTNDHRRLVRIAPARTNPSHDAKLTGWCNDTNHISTYAQGVVRIVRVAKNERAQVVMLQGEQMTDALQNLGYPELIP